MSEQVPLMPGYRLNSEIVRRDLHMLLSIFMAIRPIQLAVDGREDPIESLQARFGEAEIQHLLISTAIMNRAQLDHMANLRSDPNELSFPIRNEICGRLHQPREHEAVALTLREACNKIVHAEEISLSIEQHEPRITLSGRQRGIQWVAVVEIVRYVRA